MSALSNRGGCWYQRHSSGALTVETEGRGEEERRLEALPEKHGSQERESLCTHTRAFLVLVENDSKISYFSVRRRSDVSMCVYCMYVCMYITCLYHLSLTSISPPPLTFDAKSNNGFDSISALDKSSQPDLRCTYNIYPQQQQQPKQVPPYHMYAQQVHLLL